MIPDQILIDILRVYEFGKREEVKNLPNDLICDSHGTIWATWTRIFEIKRSNLRLINKKNKEVVK